MKKLVEIDNCLDCPHGSIVGCKCSKANRKIPPENEESIPEWCPLPDAGRATESKVTDYATAKRVWEKYKGTDEHFAVWCDKMMMGAGE